MTFTDKLNALQAQMAALRNEFTHYIVDQSVPLDERYSVWCQAPEDLKEHETYNVYFDNLPEDFVMYDGPVHADRYQTVAVDKVVDAAVNYAEEMSLDIVALKEEVLQKNIASFRYDW